MKNAAIRISRLLEEDITLVEENPLVVTAHLGLVLGQSVDLPVPGSNENTTWLETHSLPVKRMIDEINELFVIDTFEIYKVARLVFRIRCAFATGDCDPVIMGLLLTGIFGDKESVPRIEPSLLRDLKVNVMAGLNSTGE